MRTTLARFAAVRGCKAFPRVAEVADSARWSFDEFFFGRFFLWHNLLIIHHIWQRLREIWPIVWPIFSWRFGRSAEIITY